MELEHYSKHPIRLERDRFYSQTQTNKPNGFWVSVAGEDDWPSWAIREDFFMDHFEYKSEIELDDKANILILDTVEAIKGFHKRYHWALDYSMPHRPIYFIDWIKVVNDFDGIIIAPYQWSLRLDIDVSWYYGWDVASGCIWNLDAIKSINTVEHTLERSN